MAISLPLCVSVFLSFVLLIILAIVGSICVFVFPVIVRVSVFVCVVADDMMSVRGNPEREDGEVESTNVVVIN